MIDRLSEFNRFDRLIRLKQNYEHPNYKNEKKKVFPKVVIANLPLLLFVPPPHFFYFFVIIKREKHVGKGFNFGLL